MLREILHHVSLLIIESPDRRDFILGIYDDTYPLESFRGRVNLIGGNQHPEDQSPREILEREIGEEFSIRTIQEKVIEEAISYTSGAGIGAPLPQKFAPPEDIKNIRNRILTYYTPYLDFLITAPYLKNRPLGTAAIYSVYVVTLPKDIFECAREHLAHGKAIKSEGFATVVSIDNLKNGSPLAAGPASLILAHYLHTSIPDPYGLNGVVLGEPRASLADYEKEFIYTNVRRKQ